MAVDAAIGQQAHEMKRAVLLLAVVHSGGVGLILEEASVLNGLGDPGQVLEDNTARANVGVAHLTVAHLPLWQAHVQAGGGQAATGIFSKDPVQMGGAGIFDGVALLRVPQAEAIHNNQRCRCFTHV